jgi:DNA-binding NarL/FixJ family response regulator
MSPFTVALADDHPILRAMLKTILSEDKEIEVVADVGDGIALLKLLRRLPVLPDMVIIDFTMPYLAGPELIRKVRKLFPEIKILMFTMHAEMEYASEAFVAGANGYLLKEEAPDELFAAIHAIRIGQTYRSPRLM